MPDSWSGAVEPTPPEDWAEERDARARKRNKVLRIILIVLALALIASAIALLSIRQYTVVGESMEPTLRPGDRIYYTAFSKPRFNDLVIFDAGPVYGRVVKRVVGLPGDTIFVSADGRLVRNHVLLEEPYAQLDGLCNSGMQEITVAEDSYFVLGDNRAESIDSRDIRIGTISGGAIVGIVTNFVRELDG